MEKLARVHEQSIAREKKAGVLKRYSELSPSDGSNIMFGNIASQQSIKLGKL